MSIIFMDGFDLYPTIASMNRRGYNSPTSTLQTGRFSGQCWRTDFNSNSMYRSIGASLDNIAVGFAWRISNLANLTTGKSIIHFYNGGGGATTICKLGATVDGRLVFGRGDFTTNKICESASGIITANTWYYIELELVRATGSGGSINVYLDGALVANLGSTNTGSAAIDAYGFNTEGMAATADFDDMYICNVATKLGEMRIETLRPTADTATKDFSRSTGADNFALIDETLWNDDTDYTFSSTAAQKDLFDLANLSSSPLSVKAVQPLMLARKDDAATRQLRHNMKNGATTTNGTTRNLAASYVPYLDIYETNPDTAAAWTGSDVNATQLGYELVS
jgi:hypothetical protein